MAYGLPMFMKQHAGSPNCVAELQSRILWPISQTPVAFLGPIYTIYAAIV